MCKKHLERAGTNKLARVPESIAQLTALEYLSLDNTELANVPEYLGNLPALKRLNLGNN